MTQVGLHRPVWEPPHSTEAEPEAGDGMVALGKLTVYSLAAGPTTHTFLLFGCHLSWTKQDRLARLPITMSLGCHL